MRILFQTFNRRGLGHLMRAANIGRALVRLTPGVELVFDVRSAPPRELIPANAEVVCDPDPDRWVERWPQRAAAARPDVIVYDTMLPGDAGLEPVSAARVFVMRQCKPEHRHALAGSPALKRMDAILVPHERAEFDPRLNGELASRTRFVGPIVREPSVEGALRMRSKYALDRAGLVLTSTPGGGGFEADVGRFFDVVFRAHEALSREGLRLGHVGVAGPRYRGTLEAPAGMTLVASEPDLVDLFGVSDVVIAAGGYNTVHELRRVATPAVFLPGRRTHDDQHERVGRLERAGLAMVADPSTPAEAAVGIAAVCRSSRWRDETRRRCVEQRIRTGNDEAARSILELVAR